RGLPCSFRCRHLRIANARHEPRAAWRVFHAGCVERRPPPAFVVLGQLKVVALAVHPGSHAPDACPGVDPRAERPDSTVIRWPLKAGEPERCSQKPAALVEHAYSII